ncbi:MAG: CBS domain-containing protein [Pontiellaceae bacterium]|nr:CBS domain-containing protein [Pontiellaceae bacterium]MBN2786585.1 CBS domain-containing protein [Pontiellaceae bacterium]
MAPTRKKQTFWSEPIGKVDLQKAAVVPSGTTIVDAVKEMKYNQIGCVLVVDKNGKLIGILSNGDLMHEFVGSTLPGDTPVDAIMTKEPFTGTPSLTVKEALEIFHTEPFRHMPILRGNQIQGILSIRGLMTFISEHLPLEVMNLPPDSSLIAARTSGE